MNKRLTYILLAFIFLMACRNDVVEEMTDNNDRSLNLRWNASHANESREDAITSFKWALSFLGAKLPKNDFSEGVNFIDDRRFSVDFNKLGFSGEALSAFDQLLPSMKNSEEYSVMGGIDLGRFIMLTLNSTYHYYTITGAEKTFADYLKSREYQMNEVAITKSGVSKGHRLIQIPDVNELVNLSFISKEGSGKIDDGTFKVEEYEVVDIMSNGQNRFAIYDADGNLISAGKKEFSFSGKPSKCLWCHETFIQPNFVGSQALPGYISPMDFNQMTITWNDGLDSLRSTFNTALDFGRQAEHELMEITYISFMEPSAERLSKEWNRNISEIQSLLSGLNTHQHEEFPFLGDLYHRKEIEEFAPYNSLAVPDSAREFSLFEPRYIEP